MIKYVLLFALIVAIQAAPQTNPKDAQITQSENENNGSGNFRYSYQTSDGISADAVGEPQPHPDPKEPPFVAVRGSYRYVDPEGNEQITKYIADHLGYRILA